MKAVRRGPSPIATTSLVFVAVIVASGLTLFSLWALGVELPFLSQKAALAAEPTGFPIPVLARPLPAYTKITVEHFLDPKTGQLRVRYVSSKEEAEKNGFITDRQNIINRVLTRDKDAGFPFTEKDLYPKGTRAGSAAGIPVGKVGLVLAADKIQGIHALKLGDRFDLLAGVPVDMDKAFAKLKLVGTPDAQAAGKRANVRVLAQNGAVVLPVFIREIPTGSPSAAKGGPVPSKPIQEVTIAVDPEEVASIHEAIAIHSTLMCVARSGHPDEAKTTTTISGSAPPPPMHTMELIAGSKRQMLIFPSPANGPRETEMNDPGARPTDEPPLKK